MTEGTGKLEQMGLDLSPPVDDRPFFFQAASLLASTGETIKRTGLDPNIRSVSLLRTVVIVLGAVTLVLFFLPFLLFGKPGRGEGFWSGSAYYAFIGCAFMLVEIPWIQRAILYLGHPSYATATVLSALLLGAGIGSYSSSRLPLRSIRRWSLLLPCVVAIVSIGMAPLFARTMMWAFAARVGLSAILTGATGWLMGFAFPCGFLVFGDRNKPWFWAVNGAFGVFASSLSALRPCHAVAL